MSILKYLLFFVSLIFILGCRPTATLTKNFNSGVNTLNYMHNSKICPRYTQDTFSLKQVILSQEAIPLKNVIIENKFVFVPFILIYATDAEFNCIAGRELFKEDIVEFFKDKLKTETERFGQFAIDEEQNHKYQLEIYIDTVFVSSLFKYSSVFVPPGAYSEHQYSGPGNSTIKVTYKILKGDKLIIERQLTGDYPIYQNQFPIANRDRFQKEFAISFVEATSLNFREIIMMIVDDINKFLVILK